MYCKKVKTNYIAVRHDNNDCSNYRHELYYYELISRMKVSVTYIQLYVHVCCKTIYIPDV